MEQKREHEQLKVDLKEMEKTKGLKGMITGHCLVFTKADYDNLQRGRKCFIRDLNPLKINSESFEK